MRVSIIIRSAGYKVAPSLADAHMLGYQRTADCDAGHPRARARALLRWTCEPQLL